jgi:hypothetical protein
MENPGCLIPHWANFPIICEKARIDTASPSSNRREISRRNDWLTRNHSGIVLARFLVLKQWTGK